MDNTFNSHAQLQQRRQEQAMDRRTLSIEKCQDILRARLTELARIDVLHHSLVPGDLISDFEILEFYGDSVLAERIAFSLFKTKRFMNPGLLTDIRTCCINNKNLGHVFDALNLGELIKVPLGSAPKTKADAIEAMLAELSLAYCEKNHALARVALDDLIGFIFFCGEKSFYDDLGKREQNNSQQQTQQNHLQQQTQQHPGKISPFTNRQTTPTKPLREINSLNLLPSFPFVRESNHSNVGDNNSNNNANGNGVSKNSSPSNDGKNINGNGRIVVSHSTTLTSTEREDFETDHILFTHQPSLTNTPPHSITSSNASANTETVTPTQILRRSARLNTPSTPTNANTNSNSTPNSARTTTPNANTHPTTPKQNEKKEKQQSKQQTPEKTSQSKQISEKLTSTKTPITFITISDTFSHETPIPPPPSTKLSKKLRKAAEKKDQPKLTEESLLNMAIQNTPPSAEKQLVFGGRSVSHFITSS